MHGLMCSGKRLSYSSDTIVCTHGLSLFSNQWITMKYLDQLSEIFFVGRLDMCLKVYERISV